MNFVYGILSGLLILQIIVCNMLFTSYAADRYNKFEEMRLQYAVNYATDAAAREMRILSADLEQDYENIKHLAVDPQVALDTFSTIICKNYNVPVNAINQQSIMLEYVPVFVVAAYDGYYIGRKEVINSSGVENMIFHQKYPYSDVLPDGDNGGNALWSYNLGLERAIRIGSDGSVVNTTKLEKSRAEILDLINKRLSDVLNDLMTEYANKDPRGSIYIPSEFTTVRSTNAVKNTTVFAYIDNFDLGGYGMDLQSFGIGGTEIKQKKVVIGFIVNENGKPQKYYAYSDKVPNGATPVESFDSQEDAAGAGYYYYIQ